jgi:hypothetical protein
MPSQGEGNQIAERQRSTEALQLLRAFRHAYSTAKRWHAARLTGTVLVALAAPVVIVFAPWLEHPLGAIAGGWALAARLVLRPAQDAATRFAVAVQEQFDEHVLGLLPATALQPPAWEQVHQQARHHRGDPGTDWYPVRPQVAPAIAVLIAQRSGTVWSRRLHREWALVMGAAAVGWTLFTIAVAVTRGATVSEFLIAVLLPMLPALLDATDLGQAHWRVGAERSALEAQLDQRLDQAARGQLSAPEELRAVQDEISRQRLTQPPVPDFYYRLRRASYEASMRAAADRLAQRIDAAAAASPAPGTLSPASSSPADVEAAGAAVDPVPLRELDGVAPGRPLVDELAQERAGVAAAVPEPGAGVCDRSLLSPHRRPPELPPELRSALCHFPRPNPKQLGCAH